MTGLLCPALLVLATSTGTAETNDRASDEMSALARATPSRVSEPGSGPAVGAGPTLPAVPFDPHWLEPFFASGVTRAAAERFRMDDWAGAAAGFTRAVASLPARSPERLPARYMLAVARMNRGEWHEAGQIFEELHGSYPLLAPWHAYHAARCRLRRGDTAGAIAWAARVPTRTVPEAEAALIKLDALGSERRWAELEAEAGRFLERFPAGPRRAEAMFRRADAMENLRRPAAQTATIYRRIWAEAPLESWASRATERLEAAAATVTPDEARALRTRTADEWVTRGMVFFDRNQNKEAEAAFGAALAAPGLDATLACKARFHQGQSVFKQRQRPRAAPLFLEAETVCRKATDAAGRDLMVKSLYQGARCLANAGDRDRALAQYAKIEAEYPEHSYADDARLRAAELAVDAGDEERANALLTEIPSRYPQGDQMGEALWRLAFGAYRAGAWEKAHAWLDENLRRIPRENVWYAEGRALYWKARLFERSGASQEARTFYGRAVREYPLSVYALLSLERLKQTAAEDRKTLLRELRAQEQTSSAGAVWQFAPRPVFGDAGFLRAVELARMGLGPDARRELARLGFSAPESRDAARRSNATMSEQEREEIYWITAILLDRGRLWNASHAIPRYTLTGYRSSYPQGRLDAEWRISYPRAFGEIVARHTRDAGVPEALQLAIMREESAFSPRIESFANALGLTQMLVATAQRYASYRVTRETLMDPARNLELGSKYLASLLARYGGSVPLAIAGYNAGEGAVDRWLRERGELELDEFLELIPYDETRNYTKRVLSSYATYAWLYNDARPVPEISFSVRATPVRDERAARRARRR